MPTKKYTPKSPQSASEKSPDLIANVVRAAQGFDSYRYRGRFGWIYIGANSIEEALRQAKQSTDEEISVSKLFKLDPVSFQYENVSS